MTDWNRMDPTLAAWLRPQHIHPDNAPSYPYYAVEMGVPDRLTANVARWKLAADVKVPAPDDLPETPPDAEPALIEPEPESTEEGEPA